MKLKFLSLLAAVCFCSCVYAQTDTLKFTKEEMRLLDSMFNSDEVIKMLMGKDKNYFDVSVGISNREFSSNNNAANAIATNRQLIYTPAANYRLKNGFSFGATGFITGDSLNKPLFYQLGLNAGYAYYGKKINASVTYTRYVSNVNKYKNKTIYQNDAYGYLKMAKGFIRPGIALGFANGKYKEANYVMFIKTVHLPNPLPNGRDTNYVVEGYDSTNNNTRYFSASINIEHEFNFYKLLSKADKLSFVPSLIINFGSDKLIQTHTNKIFERRAFSRLKKSEFNNKFEVQSLAASFGVAYYVKKFFLLPVLYLDFYIPETTAERFGTVFSITAGFSF